MANPTVKISRQTFVILKAMANDSGETMQDILDKAVEEERRRRFTEQANASYARLREDSHAWAEYRAELDAWDTTLMDGLE